MSVVALIRCDGYGDTVVEAAVRRGLELLGGASKFARDGEKILIKPNWLASDPPEKCTCTHPAVFMAVCKLMQSTGARLSYGDSPAFQRPETVAQKSGFAEIAGRLSIPLADFRNGAEVFYESGIQNKKFTLAKGVIDSDAVISVSKLKAHGFMRFTGAIKNQFGCVPGALKGESHVKTPSAADFAKMLCDLSGCIKPRLYIMDAVMAMEGNGPRGGNPKKLSALLFSVDPVALDATACRIIGLDPEAVPTITAGFEAGMGVYAPQSITIAGDPLPEFIDPSFDVKREPAAEMKKGRIFTFVKNSLLARPVIDAAQCVKCGVCVSACPVRPKAVDWRGGNKLLPPSYTYKNCIRCYCCQELCPHGAIKIRVPLLRKMILRPKTNKITKR